MNKQKKVTTEAVLEEVRKYSFSQRMALIDDLEMDIENLAHSIANLYEAHTGVFIMHGVQVEVKFSVLNEVVYRQFLGCPEFYTRMSAMAECLKGGSQ